MLLLERVLVWLATVGPGFQLALQFIPKVLDVIELRPVKRFHTKMGKKKNFLICLWALEFGHFETGEAFPSLSLTN